MTTLLDRDASALLIVDVQVGVVDGVPLRDEVIANIATLVAKARDEHVPVVWVQDHGESLPQGSPQWQYVPELPQAEGEPVVHKAYGDAFEDTDLEDVLAERRVGRVVVAGAQTDACIRATLHGAFVRGYDVTLVGDAHTTEDNTQWGCPPPADIIRHTNLYWDDEAAPGRTAETVDTAEVSFG